MAASPATSLALEESSDWDLDLSVMGDELSMDMFSSPPQRSPPRQGAPFRDTGGGGAGGVRIVRIVRVRVRVRTCCFFWPVCEARRAPGLGRRQKARGREARAECGSERRAHELRRISLPAR